MVLGFNAVNIVFFPCSRPTGIANAASAGSRSSSIAEILRAGEKAMFDPCKLVVLACMQTGKRTTDEFGDLTLTDKGPRAGVDEVQFALSLPA